ncbi:IclR family transcriptional regulator [Alicyclobacillus cycloheptanicus]|uniref:DNA-binding IclR family transcriptional regulator n=1 Tax=Alicyclobacillus cycloheptanicus TaxID=1457 RepID=A0ABT9XMW1_9BACL|nr:IclR family transcriptional regulator [Alicyclobacillus cycloheptanicus]MDQ0191465.1 DNA-binding IclR family transcriptional regulator [Alicyclobacillus cycloheptanicus]WDM00159.1 IclR family transcriptional regulator [Alicyclobacillus cycloheptanicus]
MQTEYADHSIRVFKKIAMVLDYITDAKDPISVTAMAKELKLPRATLYRILDALEKEDILVRSESSYRLGNRLLYWAVDTLNHYSLRDLIRPHIERLSDETGLTSSFYIRVQASRVCMDRVDGRTDHRPYVRVGQHLPLHVGAPGHVLVAWLPDDERANILAQSEEHYPGLARDPKGIDWERIRQEKWAFSSAEHFRNIASLCSPILDGEGQPAGAISISGPLDHLNVDNFTTYLPLLTNVTSELTRFISRMPGLYAQEMVRGGF